MSHRAASPGCAFGLLLKEWRRVRRKSQLAVALEAEVSPRHLSFVESGRSVPSREMVQTLAEALGVPFRERNALLLAAGYAPIYPERALESSELTQVHRALTWLLDHQEPYPAVVLDRQWNVVRTNRAAPRLFAHFVDLATLPEPRNLLRTVFRKDALTLSFFSLVTTVGAPLDITAQELRIEAFFPADNQTEQFARNHLGGP